MTGGTGKPTEPTTEPTAEPTGGPTFDELLALLEGDRELLDQMEALEIVQRQGERYSEECRERARVVRTLVRELEVNWAGVDIIIRLREELLVTRRNLADALVELRERGGERD